MPWKNSIKDELPQHKEEVLISVNGINHIAHYNDTKKGFEVKETNKLFSINDKEPIIYWQKLTNPNP